MDKQQLLEFLRENLKIELETKTVSDWGSKGYKIVTRLILDEETICEASDTIDVEYRDTSETWRRSLD
jgi:hypothetical protein